MPSRHWSTRLTRYWQLILLLPSWIFPVHYSPSLFQHNQFFQHAAMTPITQLTLNLEHLATTLAQPTPKNLINQSLATVKYLESLLLITSGQATNAQFPIKPALNEVIIRHHRPQQQQFLISIINLKPNLALKGQAYFLQEALSCLIHNAFEAYPLKQSYKIVHLVATQQANFLIINICDYGRGMDWLTRKFALKAGFSAKSELKIHGQGLPFVRHVIETKFQGQLAINSRPEMGTVVMIKIPLT